MLAACAGNAQSVSGTPSYDAVALTSSSVGTMYRAVNVAAVDAYLANALLDPRQRIGPGQSCFKPDNSLSSRPSPLVNPPLAESSIAQRARLAEALAAYDIALGSFVNGEPAVASRVAVNDLQRAVFELGVAANAHAAGDLFIEDLTAELTASAGKLAAARDRNAARLIARDARPTVRKLIAVLAADVATRHAEALNAARADYESWLAYDEAARREVAGNEPAPRTSAAIPRCFAPSVPQGAPSSAVSDVASDGPPFPGHDAILARLQAARDRYDALRSASPAELVSALSALDDATGTALESTGDGNAAAGVQTALQRFRDAAQALAKASQSLAAAAP